MSLTETKKRDKILATYDECAIKHIIVSVRKELHMKRFNWIFTWLIGIVTLGIYQIYAWYTMTKQQNEMAEKLGEKKIMNAIVALLLGCVTCGIFTLVWLYKFMKQQTVLAEAKGVTLTPTSTPIVLFLLWLVPIFNIYMLCTNHNALCEAYEE